MFDTFLQDYSEVFLKELPDIQIVVLKHTIYEILRAVTSKAMRSWRKCFPINEFAYNRTNHFLNFFPFKFVYDFCSLTYFELFPLYLCGQESRGRIQGAGVREVGEMQTSRACESRNCLVFEPDYYKEVPAS